MEFTILTILFVVLGGIYLYRRKKSKPSINNLLEKQDAPKLSIDEKYNLERSAKEEKLDKLLDKINRKGIESLTELEKAQLKDLTK